MMDTRSKLSTENLEVFINDYLKEDLKHLEKYINQYNEEIMEYIQLKNTIQTMRDNFTDGYKTQMNIGGNIFMEAKVDNLDTILVDIGKGVYIPFTAEEALKFADFKIKILNKECDVLREESVKKRSAIKVTLMYMAEQEKLVAGDKD
ncbi:protein UXT homolog [Musca domestica]|uniref:Protein UXT homolog n=1 Tax=Musca domestica TaxID=7370 RepID=A0A1I8MIB0_MUSDO|nr:protein UXT homolog [Musca domestica]XP_011290305.1 protein UXT homolog [Musca domestica]XP_058974117.1 protein UXT homolog [Musca domestica]XP_058974118.1 protein UXT homolog [Musca domestica]